MLETLVSLIEVQMKVLLTVKFDIEPFKRRYTYGQWASDVITSFPLKYIK